jgi:hypothetical protein
MRRREHLKHLSTDGEKIIFKCILKKSAAGSREHGTKKPMGCHKRRGKLIDELGGR